MKKEVYRAESRGHANYGWLQTNYSFSFADYYDPRRIRFGALRVLNDDTILGGGGFPLHSHADMEIVTIPFEGALEHKDTLGGKGVIRAGDVQIMSAGSGITHSEFNHPKEEAVRLLQIWILPEKENIAPSYDQKKFDLTGRKNKFQLVVSPRHKDALFINQRAYFSLGEFEKDKKISYELFEKENGIFLFVVEGNIRVLDETLLKRDALGVFGTSALQIEASHNSSLLIIEVPNV
jgi:redox-sensitive bicupin YhaK (pirin superfamily)